MNGRLLGQTYTNSTFGFTLLVPTNWSVFKRAELEKGIKRMVLPSRRMPDGTLRMPEVEFHNLLTIAPGPIDPAYQAISVLAPTNTLSIFAQKAMPGARNG